MFHEIANYFDGILSKYQCGFRIGFSSQHCLQVLIEKWKKSRDDGGSFGDTSTRPVKVLDCLLHDLLTSKLRACGFDMPSLKLVSSYLSNRKQRVKINDNFSSWEEITVGVLQRSILRPLTF